MLSSWRLGLKQVWEFCQVVLDAKKGEGGAESAQGTEYSGRSWTLSK